MNLYFYTQWKSLKIVRLHALVPWMNPNIMQIHMIVTVFTNVPIGSLTIINVQQNRFSTPTWISAIGHSVLNANQNATSKIFVDKLEISICRRIEDIWK